jgi:hypothetical protein
MAKQPPKESENGTALMEKPKATALANAARSASRVEGDDSSSTMPRLAMFNGTADEEKKYGNHLKRGEWFDTLEARAIGTTIKIVPIAGWRTWTLWPRGQKLPTYSVRNKAEVPPEHLVWKDGQPPLASEAVNLIVLVRGEQWPYLMVFHKTSLKAYEKNIRDIETRRGKKKDPSGARGVGPGCYELTSIDANNAKNDSYKQVVARYCGDPDPDMVDDINEMFAQLDSVRQKAESAAAEDDDTPPL